MSWLLFALLTPILHGAANILDNYLANRLFKKLSTLIFYSNMLNLVFLPFVLLFQTPDMPSADIVPFILLIGAVQVLYLFPYYKALQTQDTSVITALFSLGRIFVPVLAFFFVNEVLALTQYIGFGIIVLSSVAMSLDWSTKLRFNSALGYMMLTSFLISIEAVTYKYVFEQVSWSTGFVWPLVISFVIALGFLFVPSIRRDISANRQNFFKTLPVFGAEELLTFGGTAASTYAISLAPVTIVKSIHSLQAFVVLLYAIFLHRLLPRIFKEKIDRKSVIKKSLLFLVMIFGIVLSIL